MTFPGGAVPRRRYWSLIAAALLGAVVALVPLPAIASGSEGAVGEGTPTEHPAPIVIEADHHAVDVDDPELIEELTAVHRSFEAGTARSVAAPEIGLSFTAASANTGMSVAFDATHSSPANVQAVVLAAATDWDEVLATTSATPVEIAVIWKDLGSSNLLGSAGPNGLWSGGGLPAGSFYPAPLANVLLGYDVNGGSSPELTINLNSTANWYIGTSGTPAWNQVDLYSVVLHEIGHGMGFLGSGSVHNHAPNTEPTLEDTPFVFDNQVTYGGAPLLAHGNPDALLRSDSLFINLSDSLSNKLYAPTSWKEGSSFSHFDEASYPAGSVGALMTPSLAGGEKARTIDAATLGVLARTGWPLRVGAATPLITATEGGDGRITVTWTPKLLQPARAPDAYRIEARVGNQVAASTVVGATITSATLTGLADNVAYTMAVVPVAGGVDGTATTAIASTVASLGAPRAVAATGSGTDLTITWLAPTSGTPTSYDVQVSSDDGPWQHLGTVTGLAKAVSLGEGVHRFQVRARDADGVGPWGKSLPIGVSNTVVRPLALDGQVSRLYRAYFQRDPDAAGFVYWRDQRAGGNGLESVSDAFAASPEFQATYGALDNGAFVDLVYGNVLGRPADPSGRAYWLGQLAAGASRGQVMVGFSESTEFVVNTGTVQSRPPLEDEVYRVYLAFFLREPDAGGLDYWVGVRSGGATIDTVAAAFAASSEFQATYGALPDAEFVELVYNNVLARPSDQPGRSYWVGRLAQGLDRGSMMAAFSESQEFVVATGTTP